MNKKINLPAVYHPTTALFLDDNINFLNSIPFAIDDDLPYITESDPCKALLTIESYGSHVPFHITDMEKYDEGYDATQNSNSIHINIQNLYEKIYNPKRFDQISVVVVDYSMPKMNAIDFCRKISDPYIKKIMLTGAADSEIAVQAFNEGIIDKFFVKGKDDISNINLIIRDLQKKNFLDRSLVIQDLFLDNSTSILKESDFIHVMESLMEQYDIIEFYLVESSGSYLFLDRDGAVKWFFVRSQEEMKMFCELAISVGLTYDTVKEIEQGRKMPCFPQHIPFYSADSEQWESCLYETTPYSSSYGTFYYAFIEDQFLELQSDNIIAFNDYMKHKWE